MIFFFFPSGIVSLSPHCSYHRKVQALSCRSLCCVRPECCTTQASLKNSCTEMCGCCGHSRIHVHQESESLHVCAKNQSHGCSVHPHVLARNQSPHMCALRIRVTGTWCGLKCMPRIRVPACTHRESEFPHTHWESESPGMHTKNQSHWHLVQPRARTDNQGTHVHALRIRVTGAWCGLMHLLRIRVPTCVHRESKSLVLTAD